MDHLPGCSEHCRRQHYFPPESVNRQYLKPSTTTSWCRWKGLANHSSKFFVTVCPSLSWA
ncbi:DUF427 domain-containing protein [Bradyrhizobium cenepequi]